MNLIETYATSSGLKIGEPFIYEKFFPIPFEKYVLIHAGGGQRAKQYDLYEEVLTLLIPILSKEGYNVLQIGAEDDPKLNFIADLRGSSSLGQTAYLIRNASLLIGNDSCNAHMASHFKTPHLVLFGSTSPKNHAPAFGGKSIYLESHRNGNKPSFVSEENPKTINFIKPEEIANAALKLLNLEQRINIETLYIGPKFPIRFLELVMDTVMNPQAFPGAVPVARMDYLFDEDMLANNLQGRAFGIVTNKPINIELLKTFKRNIAGVVYLIEEGSSTKFVKDLMNNGIGYQVATYVQGEELGKLKLEFFDYGIIDARTTPTKDTLENSDKMDISSLCKTNKFLLSKDEIFLSKKLWQEHKPTPSFEENSFLLDLEDADLLKEIQHYYIYNAK